MRLKLVILWFLFLSPSIFFAQDYTHIYYLNTSLYTVDKDKAVITGKGFNEGGNFRLDCFLARSGELVFTIHFKDSSIALLEGEFIEYNNKGKISKKGYYHDDKKHGVWQEWDSLSRKTDSVFYQNGQRLVWAEYSYYTDPEKKITRVTSYGITDSLADTFDEEFYSDSNTVSSRIHFTGQTGIWKIFSKEGMKLDTVYSREEKEAEFPGGNKAWAQYLQKTLGGFNPGEQGARSGKYKVLVKFIVDKDGTISDVKPETNFGHKMESTVVKIIENGPKWIPAKQFGRPVKAYRRQPVTFIVENY